jgi:hypothetical protein
VRVRGARRPRRRGAALAGAAVRLRLGDEAALARIRQVTGCGDNAEEVLRWMGARDRVGRDCERVSRRSG